MMEGELRKDLSVVWQQSTVFCWVRRASTLMSLCRYKTNRPNYTWVCYLIILLSVGVIDQMFMWAEVMIHLRLVCMLCPIRQNFLNKIF